jgi:hypothetical protein
MDLKEQSKMVLSKPTDSLSGPVVGVCEHGKKPSGSIKGWECLDVMNNHQLLVTAHDARDGLTYIAT